MELVTAVMVVLVLVKDGTMEDSEVVAVVNSLDQVLVEVGLEDVLLVSGLVVLLMVEVVDLITKVHLQQIRQVVTQVILLVHTQEMDILR